LGKTDGIYIWNFPGKWVVPAGRLGKTDGIYIRKPPEGWVVLAGRLGKTDGGGGNAKFDPSTCFFVSNPTHILFFAKLNP
jgi:hypothetical protein